MNAKLHVYEGRDGTTVWVENAHDLGHTAYDVVAALEEMAPDNAIAHRALELHRSHPQRGCWWTANGANLVLVDG